MVHIELIKETETTQTMRVNGKTIEVDNNKLSAVNRQELNDGEQRAISWFVKSTLNIKSSIFNL